MTRTLTTTVCMWVCQLKQKMKNWRTTVALKPIVVPTKRAGEDCCSCYHRTLWLCARYRQSCHVYIERLRTESWPVENISLKLYSCHYFLHAYTKWRQAIATSFSYTYCKLLGTVSVIRRHIQELKNSSLHIKYTYIIILYTFYASFLSHCLITFILASRADSGRCSPLWTLPY